MSEQMTIFDAIRERDEAMGIIDQNTREEFRKDARNAVLTVGRMRFTFTSDEVFEWLESHRSTKAHDPRALGPIMSKLAKENKIIFTGEYAPSRRRHCSPIRVWRLV
jgi:hypothetical protein